mmetsp:Transcript_6650/g.14207  ORF Transcript_6650/g.14207 Transcript_6650/m.14207 type:complete len:213 (+) Transcript_6650:121-759(+)|eukprot:CAMPEP_0185854298 /NCGR_PEP_ID=MMETSP1354-20130828/21908_1 /TAXON_ID=708628 /ORGANISM="Erythrolobus madagascarensis, Strain CCMP3276" /LENGTH=212 /DNA_ID=CAMNT_0028556025 /DNA_START=120 /DNA_END=758 /DNA_ORIENTATION=+
MKTAFVGSSAATSSGATAVSSGSVCRLARVQSEAYSRGRGGGRGRVARNLVGFDISLEEAVRRISIALPEYTEEEIKAEIARRSNNDELALLELTKNSAGAKENEERIARFRENGRISAMQEAELRRRVTGSARDFFKTQIEVKGEYVDAGYVDDSADAMGSFMTKVGGWFGFKPSTGEQKSTPAKEEEKKPFVPRVTEIVSSDKTGRAAGQ